MRKHDTMYRSPRSLRQRVLVVGLAALVAMGSVFGANATNPYAQAIETLADKLATHFVDPAVGQRYAEMLRANLAAGRYEDVGDAKAVAQRLTQDLQAVAADGHLRVDLAPEPDALHGPGPDGPRRVGGSPPDDGPRPSEAPPPRMPPTGHAPPHTSALAPVDLPSVAETRWIAEGVAYIRFNQFAGEPASMAAMQAFVRDYVTAKAIIIDTRTLSRGGGLAEMDALFPYLFAHETVLVEMAVAKDDGPRGGPAPMDSDTLRAVPSPASMIVRQHVAVPDATEHRLTKAKVFYLTSRRTRSAGEHFALALQRTHRGTLIGERTAGANHFGGIEPLGAGLAAFIPVGRTYDPDTGKDWEGTGIVPDIEVPVGQALDKALALAGG